MTCQQLNKNSIWSNLPWQAIKMRVFILQKQIYQASKICNLSLMYKWQNILLNCNEAKVFAIENTCHYIFHYYSSHSLVKYHFIDQIKVFLLDNIYQIYSNNLVIKNLLELSKQYIFYLCIQPEWEAKNEFLEQRLFNYSQMFSYLSLLDYYNLSDCINHSIKKTNINQINFKYFNSSYLIQKCQSLNYIKYCIKIWMNNSFIYTVLNTLIYKILFNGKEWCKMKYLEYRKLNEINHSNNYLYRENLFYTKIQNCKNTSFIFNLVNLSLRIHNQTENFYNREVYKVAFNEKFSFSSDFCKYELNTILTYCIKSVIYKKNLFNRLRIEKNFKLSTITYLLIKKCKAIYSLLYICTDIKFFLSMKLMIHYYLSLWIKKKHNKYSPNHNSIDILIVKNLLIIKTLIINNLFSINSCEFI